MKNLPFFGSSNDSDVGGANGFDLTNSGVFSGPLPVIVWVIEFR